MDPWAIVGIVILLIVTAWFSGCETAIESCNQFKIKVKANDGDKISKFTVKIIDNFDNFSKNCLETYNNFFNPDSSSKTIYNFFRELYFNDK
jgi:Mg2+/Co2+ transporter CorB